MFPAITVIKKILSSILFSVQDPWKRSYYLWMIRYSLTPRFREMTLTLPNGMLWTVVDIASFFSMYKSIFLQRVYDFSSSTPSPVILDCGANIGMSILFFKLIYPKAHVTAFEVDPYIFSILKMNIRRANLKGVTLINKGVWDRTTTLPFDSDHADGGHIAENSTALRVNMIDFREFLKNHKGITFLKMDIEGAEQVVVPHCIEEITAIPSVFIEYHSYANKKQNIGSVVHAFEKKGYRLQFHHEFISQSPLRERLQRGNMDHQFDIFAWKQSY